MAPLLDKRVEIHGTSRSDMNGKRGVATDFHAKDGGMSGAKLVGGLFVGDDTTWRYTVMLDGGESFKVKLSNVRAEGAGKAKPKDKGMGKGKKGRSAGRN